MPSPDEDQPRSLHEALVKFQAQAPKITKNARAEVQTKKKDGSKGPTFHYDYVTLTHLSEEVLPILASLGLAWITMPTWHDGRPMLDYELAFENAEATRETIEGTMPLMVTSGGPQDLGGAITYMRRYALCAVLGLAPEADDDAARAQQTRTQKPKAATKAEVKALVGEAVRIGVLDTLQLAASHVVQSDVGSCETEAEAEKALAKLTTPQAGKLADWLRKKEDENESSDES